MLTNSSAESKQLSPNVCKVAKAKMAAQGITPVSLEEFEHTHQPLICFAIPPVLPPGLGGHVVYHWICEHKAILRIPHPLHVA
jgi:hypothetical protein